MSPSTDPTPAEEMASGKPNTRRAGRPKCCPTCGYPPPRPKKPRADTTDADYRAGLLRLVNGYGPRVKASGTAALADAVAIRAALDAIIDAAVETCRGPAWSASWAELADALGVSRSTVAERYAAVESARRPGGQPSNLR